MFSRNYIELNKITLARWVNKVLDQTLIRKNIILKFKGTRVWPFNLRAMEEKTSPSTLYTLVNRTREDDDDDYHSNEEDGEQQWTKHAIIKELLNIGLTIKVTTHDLFKDQLWYYVKLLKIPTITNHTFVIKLKKTWLRMWCLHWMKL